MTKKETTINHSINQEKNSKFKDHTFFFHKFPPQVFLFNFRKSGNNKRISSCRLYFFKRIQFNRRNQGSVILNCSNRIVWILELTIAFLFPNIISILFLAKPNTDYSDIPEPRWTKNLKGSRQKRWQLSIDRFINL